MRKEAKPAKENKKRHYQNGLKAERWAGWLMRLKGYRILARRYKAKGGEIDLICQRADCLVFLEVKYRASLDEALYAITPRNQARIITAAQGWLSKHPDETIDTYRFDVMVFAPGKRYKPHYRHIEAAFEAF